MAIPKWASRLTASGPVCALPAIAVYVFYICMDVGSLHRLVINRLAAGADFGLVVSVAARIATVMTFGLLVTLFVIRRPAVSWDGRVLPNLAGLAGFGLPCVLMLLTRAPAVVGFDTVSSMIVFAGNAGVVVTLSHLGRSLSILPQARRLVTSGPYALVRHPLYFFEVITFWGIFLQFRSIGAAALVLAITCVQVARMRFEETVLSSAFAEYASYRRSVPLLFPRFGAGMGSLWAAFRQTAPRLFAFSVLFSALFAAAVTVLPGLGWRVVHSIAQPNAPVVTALTRRYATREECEAVASTMAENARQVCPQCSVEAHCASRLDSDQEAAVAGRRFGGSSVRTSDVTYLLPPGPDGRATCGALADQLRAAGNSGISCDTGESVH